MSLNEPDTEFMLERRLRDLSPSKSAHFRTIVLVMENILNKTRSLFPDFTDHTIRHSLIVMEYLNTIVGSEIEKMNVDEIYILMCAVYMHDFGMTMDQKHFDMLKDKILPAGYLEEHKDDTTRDIIRKYHNEFSAELIKQYAPVFEFPSEEYTYCVAQVSRGHRKTDLYDSIEYNPKYKLKNGNTVCLPYLAALLRLGDEMDISIERNASISYLEHKDTMSYRQHFAIKQLKIMPDHLLLKVQSGEEDVLEACKVAIGKLEKELKYCVDVTDKVTDFTISQKYVKIDIEENIKKTAVILDTDLGIDDAFAISIINALGDFKPNYIVATPGNASLDQAVKNAIILKHLFDVDAVVVKGEEPEDMSRMLEKNTFHGLDGMANISGEVMSRRHITEDELNDYISLNGLRDQLAGYDEIIYISICPLNSLATIYLDERLKNKFSRLYIMGGGLKEFNCSNNTEFNFSKAPMAVKQMLSWNLDVTLFPLDLTNHQFLTQEDIDELKGQGAMEEAIKMLEFNRQSNIEFNDINGAVLHDAMPLLFLAEPEKFSFTDIKISSDEYGAIFEAPEGSTVKAVFEVEKGLLKKYIREYIVK